MPVWVPVAVGVIALFIAAVLLSCALYGLYGATAFDEATTFINPEDY